MKEFNLNVQGMTCASCAQSVSRLLEKKGMQEISVNFIDGKVHFLGDSDTDQEDLFHGIQKLGYDVVRENEAPKVPRFTDEMKLLVSALFTLPLLLHHILMSFGAMPHIHGISWWQLGLTLPVMAIGWMHFGRGGIRSVLNGAPTMDALILTGSTAAFGYSLVGSLTGHHEYEFYETAASIFTLVLLGNLIEKRAVKRTSSSLNELEKLQAEQATVVIRVGQMETLMTVPVKNIHIDDEIAVNEGDGMPLDGEIISGTAWVDESMLTGESIPVEKVAGSLVVSGTIVTRGSLRVRVTAISTQTTLARIIESVKNASMTRPPMQKLADKIAAIFVPAVIIISILSLLLNYFVLGQTLSESVMRSVAVLAISCPCAMGLATPTAISVGVGRLARRGIIVKDATVVERMAGINRVAFDKTGTLTTGAFSVEGITYFTEDTHTVDNILLLLESHSSHPLAKSIVSYLNARQVSVLIPDYAVREEKGRGVFAEHKDGLESWAAVSLRTANELGVEIPEYFSFSVFLISLGPEKKLWAALEPSDEIRTEAKETVAELKRMGLKTVMISGDRKTKATQMAETLGIDKVYAEQSPELKLRLIREYAELEGIAMVGDGINDAPALAGATVGVSLTGASSVAMQTAQMVLTDGKLTALPSAFRISRLTVRTIKESLFCKLCLQIAILKPYNIII